MWEATLGKQEGTKAELFSTNDLRSLYRCAYEEESLNLVAFHHIFQNQEKFILVLFGEDKLNIDTYNSFLLQNLPVELNHGYRLGNILAMKQQKSRASNQFYSEIDRQNLLSKRSKVGLASVSSCSLVRYETMPLISREPSSNFGVQPSETTGWQFLDSFSVFQDHTADNAVTHSIVHQRQDGESISKQNELQTDVDSKIKNGSVTSAKIFNPLHSEAIHLQNELRTILARGITVIEKGR